jgi:UDP-N-acetylglucosamine 2-epimerase (non-hydrolysing)
LKIAIVLGTRPEIIKMSPVVRALERRQADYFILHTGQHYSYNLDRIFFKQLNLPEARYNLEVGSGSHAKQTARILERIEDVFIKETPDIILVEGDTNSVLAATLAAVKLHIKVGHVEAGLRSYDREMPEEVNRVLTDHSSDYLFAPTEKARQILLGEGIKPHKIHVTGNTIVDAVYQNIKIADQMDDILGKLKFAPRQYFLATVHRQENVDNRERFTSLLNGLDAVAAQFGCPVIYPIHPHAKKRMEEFGISVSHVNTIEPVDYFSFLHLEKNARLVFTDSGGVQEESCILHTPCVTLRDNTERPETLEVGANVLAGVISDKILDSARNMLAQGNDWRNPFGDGKASERIVDIINGGNNV